MQQPTAETTIGWLKRIHGRLAVIMWFTYGSLLALVVLLIWTIVAVIPSVRSIDQKLTPTTTTTVHT